MFQLFLKEIREFVRDKTNLFFFLLFPIILIFLLGNLLSQMDQAEQAIGELKIHYLIYTDEIQDVTAIESFIQLAGDQSYILFEKSLDEEMSKQAAGKDEIAALVIFHGEPFRIQIFEGMNQIKNRTVGAIMNSFTQTHKAIGSVMDTAPHNITQTISTNQVYLKQKDLGVNRSMLDYYAVTMLGMMSFMSIIFGAAVFGGERYNKTINRLIIAPKNRVSLFLQKVLGIIPQILCQIAIIMIISVFVFHANYATNLIDNLYLFFMFFLMTLAAVSTGAVIGLLVKGNPTALIMPPLWIMMFFGGTYSKEMYIKGLTEAMPIYQIQQAAFDLAVFGRYEKANVVVIVCTIVLMVMLGVGAFIFSKKEEER